MTATDSTASTDRALRRLRAVASMHRWDRDHADATMWIKPTELLKQADALLDELLVLHPEMRERGLQL